MSFKWNNNLIHFGRKLMPSFDIVSEITMHEVRNAVESANRH